MTTEYNETGPDGRETGVKVKVTIKTDSSKKVDYSNSPYNDMKFFVDGNERVLKNWQAHACANIIRFYKDPAFHDYICSFVLSKSENPPGPFTRFLYWFGNRCECGWDVMVGCKDDGSGRIFLKDKYYKWMHELRDELEKNNQLHEQD